jgi:hypothetical protein
MNFHHNKINNEYNLESGTTHIKSRQERAQAKKLIFSNFILIIIRNKRSDNHIQVFDKLPLVDSCYLD